MSDTHLLTVRVWYEDTDLSGLVYHANYLKFAERARSDWVRARGIDQGATRARGEVFVVTRIEADYLGSARLDDLLEVSCAVAGRRGARLELAQEVRREGTVLFRARVTVVRLGPGGRPMRLPEGL